MSTIGPIGAPLVRPGVLGGTPGADGAAAGAGAVPDFGGKLGQALDSVQATQSKADGLAKLAATGQLDDVHEYTIAAAQAQLATQLTVAVRNKALESFNEIMRMQV